ncbi:MAG TPA: TolC family protein [Opitutaceae bacterium]|nr:TolC family protein [Opitutaceae bacterium]
MRWIILLIFLSSYAARAAADEAVAPAAPGGPHLSLDDAIRLALDRNKSIKVDAFFRTIARANLLEARGRFDPALTFRRSYDENRSPVSSGPLVLQETRTDDYNLALEGLMPWGLSYSLGGSARNQRGSFNGFNDSFDTFGGIVVTQPLLRGFGLGANLVNVRIAKADRAMADWAFRQSAIATVTRVIVAYSDLVFAKENLLIARRARVLVDSLVVSNERRFNAGTMSQSDVLQARAQAAQRGEAILFAERAVRDSDNALRHVIGEETFSLNGPILAVEAPALPAGTPVNPAEDLKTAYELRPDYQGVRLGLGKRRATDAVARNQLLPTVDVVGSYGYSGLDHDFSSSRRMVADQDHRSYSAGVVVSVPLTFAEGRGRARAARLELRQGEADLERLSQDIALSVMNAAGQIETTRQRVASTQRAFELANEALAGELKRLQAGTTTTFVVLNLQTNLTQIESNRSRALADQRRAYANYEREIGVTLERHAIQLTNQ